MLFNCGFVVDYDSWEVFGNEGWGWEGFYFYFIKFSCFDFFDFVVVEEFNMIWGEEFYSDDGLIYLSFFFWQFLGIKVQCEVIIEVGVEFQVDG